MPALDIAAALASLLQGGSPLLLEEKRARTDRDGRAPGSRRPCAVDDRERRTRRLTRGRDTETYRIEVGYVHGVKPGNIVGAIANVAGLEGRQIGHVDIREDHTFVGLPRGMPEEVLRELAKTRVAGQMLRISQAADVPPKPLRKPPKHPPKRAPGKRARRE